MSSLEYSVVQFSSFYLQISVCSTTDTVISVEADPEVEALSGKPVRHVEHTHIDLELGHDIPGLVTRSHPEVYIYMYIV